MLAFSKAALSKTASPMAALLLACVLLLAAPLSAQNPVVVAPPGVPGVLYTPEIHLGSATDPSTITEPPIEEVSPIPPEPYVSNAPPASTTLLSTRHFDFITSPLNEVIPGSMEDTSISLGEYARQLRAAKQKPPLPPAAAPNAIAGPTNSPTQ